jgi:tetratricopeptide (TPR) repeat protein
LNLGNEYFDKQDYDTAVAEYTQAIRLDNNSTIADYGLANARLDANSALAYYGRANAYSAKGYIDSAIEDYKSAISLHLNDPWSAQAKAAIQKLTTQTASASIMSVTTQLPQQLVDQCNNQANTADVRINGCTTAVQSRYWSGQDLSWAYTGLAHGKYDKKDYAAAIANYTEAIRLDPNNTMAYYSRGRAYSSKGDNFSAIEDYKLAVSLNSNDEGGLWPKLPCRSSPLRPHQPLRRQHNSPNSRSNSPNSRSIRV